MGKACGSSSWVRESRELLDYPLGWCRVKTWLKEKKSKILHCNKHNIMIKALYDIYMVHGLHDNSTNYMISSPVFTNRFSVYILGSRGAVLQVYIRSSV